MNTFPAKRIDRDIGHDPVKPGIKGGLPFKPVNRFPGFEEPVLSQIPRILLILDHPVHHHKCFVSVPDDQFVKCVRITSLTSPYQNSIVWLD
jgi:hypothetical protein